MTFGSYAKRPTHSTITLISKSTYTGYHITRYVRCYVSIT